jgi:arsenate reductase (glutaredoxin)
MEIRVFTYKHCGTCRKAVKWLDANEFEYEEIPIRQQPPTRSELQAMLACYRERLQKLFNTSGHDYKALNLKERLPQMTKDEAIELLSSNGNLVKRPFLLRGNKGLVGFDENEWREFFQI